ncbi:MAG: 16S rRNA processing protein RimM [Bacteroidetes bacterium]|nr:16S rRNA processing protein RimM [Bacteroidota bacterium]MBS1670779.1 16S rRNA processing protein RimM [Bacteroidota bacterium]
MKNIHIGKIVATFGVKGELILLHALGKKTTFKKGDVLFIEFTKNAPLPFFVEASKARTSEENLVLLESITSKETAHKFIGKKVWVPETDFKKLAAKQSAISLLGMLIVDNGKPLAAIEEIIEQPHQILVKITLQNKEVLIPLHEEVIVKADKKNNQLHVILPDGLLDVYLS